MKAQTLQKNIQPKTSMRLFSGKVVSDKMKDTVVVAVERYVKAAKYEKFIRRTKRFKVHDPGNTRKVGETVTFVPCRPISKEKRFTLKVD